MKSERNLSFDVLRIIACFGVILLHASARLWYYLPISSGGWLAANCVNVLTRISVPIFVMISGALFLDPKHDVSISQIWKKHILRMGIIYGLWMSAYALLAFIQFPASDQTLTNLLKAILSGRYHLWFLPMIIGLYALIPVLRAWLSHAEKKNVFYFLMLFFVFQILRVSLKSFFVTPELLNFLDNFEWQALCGYLGYFLLGYYLFHFETSEKSQRFLIFGIPLFYLGNVIVSTWQTHVRVQAQSAFIDSFGIFTFLTSIGVFLLFTKKNLFAKSAQPLQKMIQVTSKSTLGIYLMHLMVMESSWISPIFELRPVLLAILTVSVITFLISLIITFLLRSIPFAGKYVC